ncbi:MAG TPA: STAS domain-containing protein [Gaiellaceae bacterium]|nr:STAS domain-containing protein [Gaiellaceae bacterium]
MREDAEGLRRPPVEGVDRRNGTVVVRLAGELDLYNSGEVGETLTQVAGESPDRVVVDLGEVSFIDSTALGTLVEARKHVQDGRLLLASPAPEVRRALEVSGLLALFAVHDSLDDALADSK